MYLCSKYVVCEYVCKETEGLFLSLSLLFSLSPENFVNFGKVMLALRITWERDEVGIFDF